MTDQRAKLDLAPRAGFEPATNRLTAGCSTAELPGNTAALACKRIAYNKAGKALKAPKGPGRMPFPDKIRFSALMPRSPAGDGPAGKQGSPSRSCAAVKAGGHARN